jgi:Fur family peroxide stress response transcriptional regulator
MITNLDNIKNLLQEAGIKPTYQRLAILNYLEQCGQHPTVDTIYENLLKRIPTISKTTVYNTLAVLVTEGLVHAVTITGSEVRYGIKSANHHHFMCIRCGQIFDIEVECSLAANLPKMYLGHQILEVHGYFKGICKQCLSQNER